MSPSFGAEALSCDITFPAPSVLLVTLNRPRQLNVLTRKGHQELDFVWRWFDDTPDLIVAILTGSGRVFSGGADLREWETIPEDERGVLPTNGFGGLSLRRGKKPIIAALNGLCVGGSTEMVINCDLVVASTKASLALPDVKVGLTGLGGCFPRLCKEAFGWGLIDRIVEEGTDVVQVALNLAKEIAANSPDAIIATRDGLLAGEDAEGAFEAGRAFIEKWLPLVTGDNCKEGIAAFNQRRKPRWKPSKFPHQYVPNPLIGLVSLAAVTEYADEATAEQRFYSYVMNGWHEAESPPADQRSHFTFRDLRLLEKSSSLSPLRVIALVDFDCFYAQCESVRLGLTEDQPLGVQQFLHVICINYAARAAGLPKVLTAVEAKEKCPDIVLQHVPTWRAGDETWAYRDDVLEHMQTDKSCLDYYRLQSRLAFSIVEKELPSRSKTNVEKAGIDEFFVDLSSHVHHMLLQRYPELVVDPSESLDTLLPQPPTTPLDWCCDAVVGDKDDSSNVDWDDIALSIGAEIVQSLRRKIYAQLRYTCSGGVARNKVLAKLAAGQNKPNKQTVVRNGGIPDFLSNFKFRKLRGLGGKLGLRISTLFATEQLSDLLPISLSTMQSELGPEAGQWAFYLIRGIDHSVVTSRTQIQSMMSQKTFSPGLKSFAEAAPWLQIFVADILGRLEDEQGRRPTVLTVNHAIRGRFGPMHSKQAAIPWGAQLDSKCLISLAKILLQKISDEHPAWPCQALSICISNFKDQETASGSIVTFLTPKKRKLSLDHGQGEAGSTLLVRKIKSSSSSADSGLAESAISIDDETKFNERKSTADTTLNPLEMYTCPKCTEQISAEDVLEHLDWHFAKDLQDTS